MSTYRRSIAALGGLVVLALLVACTNPASTAGPSSGGNAPGGGGGTAVTIVNFAFDPASVTVKVGTTVTWTNKDSVAHTVTADDGSWGGPVGAGQSFSQKFDTAGSFAYHCDLHPSMHGTVVVS